MVPPKAPSPVLQSSPTVVQPSPLGNFAAAPPSTAHSGDHEQTEVPMVSTKAKPPTPTVVTMSHQAISGTTPTDLKDRPRSRKPKGRRPSRSSRSSRRSLRRKRASSHRPHRGHHASTRPGSRHHHESSSHRREVPSRLPRTAYIYSWA